MLLNQKNKLIYGNKNHCPCNSDCMLINKSFQSILLSRCHLFYLYGILTSNKDIPKFKVFTEYMQIFHIKWESYPTLFHKSIIYNIILDCFNDFEVKSIKHYYNE